MSSSASRRAEGWGQGWGQGACSTHCRSTRDVFPMGCQGWLWVQVRTLEIPVMLLPVQQSFG